MKPRVLLVVFSFCASNRIRELKKRRRIETKFKSFIWIYRIVPNLHRIAKSQG